MTVFGIVTALVLIVIAAIAIRRRSANRQEAEGPSETVLEKYFFTINSVPNELINIDDQLQSGTFLRGYDGSYNNCRTVILVFLHESGRNSYEQSFIAVERPDAAPMRSVPLGSVLGMTVKQGGRWVIGTVTDSISDEALTGYLECLT
jgi:hypothetical protein